MKKIIKINEQKGSDRREILKKIAREKETKNHVLLVRLFVSLIRTVVVDKAEVASSQLDHCSGPLCQAVSDKEKEIGSERDRERKSERIITMRSAAKQGVQGLGRCYALGNLFKLFSLLTTNVRQSLPNAFLLSLTPIPTFLFWLGLCLFCFDFRGFLDVLAIF